MKIAVLPGDGIGPEIVTQAVRVLEALRSDGLRAEMEHAAIGGAGHDQTGDPLPAATLELARKADAVLLGAVGGPKYDTLPRALRPEQGLDEPGFRVLLRFLATGQVWVKLSAPYVAEVGPPWRWAVRVARRLIETRPDRMLWGTNWPHPNQAVVPETSAMLDLLLEWAGTEAQARQILVDNPARLYGYEAVAG